MRKVAPSPQLPQKNGSVEKSGCSQLENKPRLSLLDLDSASLYSSPVRSSFSTPSHASLQASLSGRRQTSVTGTVKGETSTHFLIQHQSSWCPVRKSAFKSSENGQIPKLSSLKGVKVQVSNLDSASPTVSFPVPDINLMNLSAQLESDSSFLQQGNHLEEELERQVGFNAELLADVVGLTSLSFSAERSRNYLKMRASAIKSDLSATFSGLLSNSTQGYVESVPICRHLTANMDCILNQLKSTCADCKVAISRVQLSCGHGLCADCSKDLVAYTTGSELKLHRCPACLRDLTTTDARLILLEKYNILRKGLKYAGAFGVESRNRR